MKIILNKDFLFMRSFCEDIEKRFSSGKSLRESRNSIRICKEQGREYNVKRFRQPRLHQRLIYLLFRKPKGLRAYLNPTRMKAAGVESPEPVAYIEQRHRGLIKLSYFVSVQCPYQRRFYEFAEKQLDDETRQIIREFARLTARLHEAGIHHCDYSPGNILFDRVDGEWHFSIVDTNRMKFGRVSVKKGCKNFKRLWGTPEFFQLLADEYAAARNANPEKCRRWVLTARRNFWLRYTLKHGAPFNITY